MSGLRLKLPIVIPKKWIPFICLGVVLLIVFWLWKTRPALANKPAQVHQAEKSVQQKYQKELSSATSDYELARIYHAGIPDRFVGDGLKARGVQPNARKALELYQSAINKGDRPGESAMEMANIYHYGLHDYPANIEKALHWYYLIYTESEDDYLKGLAYEKLIEIEDQFPQLKGKTNLVRGHHNPNVREHYFPEELYPGAFPVSHDTMGQQNYRQPWNTITSHENFLPYRYAEPQPYQTGYEPDNNINNVYETVQPSKKKLSLKKNQKKKQPRVRVKNDPQNTHDSLVVQTINKSLQNLESCTNIKKSPEQTLREIRSLIVESGHLTNDQAADALKVLDSIERNVNEHSVFQKTEADILNLVYNRIETHEPDKQEELKRSLLEELADAVEYDHVVCSSGRASRIVDTLNHLDSAVNIKPTWCLSKELIDATNNIRKQHYDRLNDYEKMCIDTPNPNPEQEEFYSNFVGDIKNEVKGKFYQDYVEPGLVSEQKLTTELNKWIDAAF